MSSTRTQDQACGAVAEGFPLPLVIEKDHEEIPRRMEPEVTRGYPVEISGPRKDAEWTRRLPVVPPAQSAAEGKPHLSSG